MRCGRVRVPPSVACERFLILSYPHPQFPILVLSRHVWRGRRCLLLGAKLTSQLRTPTSENDPERKSAITKIFCLTAADAFQAPTFDRYTTQVHYASCQRGDRGETDEGPPTDDRQDADGRGTAGRHRRRYGIRDDGFCIRTRNAPGGMDQGRECTPGLSVGRH